MYHQSKWSLVLRGLFGIAIGFFILFRPLDSVAAFALVIAFWAILDGISHIVLALELRTIVPHWAVMLLSGIVSTLFGMAALYYYPALSLSFAVVWTAVWLLLLGAIGVFVSIQERRMNVQWGWTLTLGIVTIAVGVLAFAYPGLTLAGLLSLIAVFAILTGVVRLMAAWKMNAFEHRVESMAHKPARA
jgi:uncharacterized membrane protein HdeD (DUF308 family)